MKIFEIMYDTGLKTRMEASSYSFDRDRKTIGFWESGEDGSYKVASVVADRVLQIEEMVEDSDGDV